MGRGGVAYGEGVSWSWGGGELVMGGVSWSWGGGELVMERG